MLRNDIYISYNDKIAENTFWNLGARVNTSLKVPLLIILFFITIFENRTEKFHVQCCYGIVKKHIRAYYTKANLSTGFRVPNIDELKFSNQYKERLLFLI
jgi:hemoglobin/transferrin/lactoferrin receptor protein